MCQYCRSSILFTSRSGCERRQLSRLTLDFCDPARILALNTLRVKLPGMGPDGGRVEGEGVEAADGLGQRLGGGLGEKGRRSRPPPRCRGRRPGHRRSPAGRRPSPPPGRCRNPPGRAGHRPGSGHTGRADALSGTRPRKRTLGPARASSRARSRPLPAIHSGSPSSEKACTARSIRL